MKFRESCQWTSPERQHHTLLQNHCTGGQGTHCAARVTETIEAAFTTQCPQKKKKKKKKAKHFSSSLSCFTIARQRSTIFTHFWKPATRLLTTSLMVPVQVLFNQVLDLWVGSSNGTWHHRQVICWGQSSQTGHLCLLSPQGETGTSKDWELHCQRFSSCLVWHVLL